MSLDNVMAEIHLESRGKIMTSIISPNVFFGKYNKDMESNVAFMKLYKNSSIEVNSLVFQMIKNIEVEFNTFIFNKITTGSAIPDTLDDSLINLPFPMFLSEILNAKKTNNTLYIIADKDNRKLLFKSGKVEKKDLTDEYLSIEVRFA